MKKLVTLGLVAVFGTLLVTGCQKKETVETPAPAAEQPKVIQETGTTATTTTTTTTGTAMTTTETTATAGAPSTTTTTTETTTTSAAPKKM